MSAEEPDASPTPGGNAANAAQAAAGGPESLVCGVSPNVAEAFTDPAATSSETVDPEPRLAATPSGLPDVAAQAAPAEDGVDAVRAAVNRARTAARAGHLTPARALSKSRRRALGDRRSGAAPDARDPQLLASGMEHLVRDRGWQTPLSIGGVMGRWSAVVGEQVAEHCQPVSFRDQQLVVQADSTAWATQVRLLIPTLLARLAAEVGEDVVTAIVVRGPHGPSWRKGRWVAPGSQGPRDTYG